MKSLQDKLFILEMRFYVWRHLTIPNFFWKLRGLKACNNHGYHAQSWIDGTCRECELDKKRPATERIVREEIKRKRKIKVA